MAESYYEWEMKYRALGVFSFHDARSDDLAAVAFKCDGKSGKLLSRQLTLIEAILSLLA